MVVGRSFHSFCPIWSQKPSGNKRTCKNILVIKQDIKNIKLRISKLKMCISFFFCSTPLPPHIHSSDFHEREPIEVETDIYQSLVEIKVRSHWILCKIPTGVICPLFHFSADRFLCSSWAPGCWWHWCRKVRVCMLFVFVVFLFFFHLASRFNRFAVVVDSITPHTTIIPSSPPPTHPSATSIIPWVSFTIFRCCDVNCSNIT